MHPLTPLLLALLPQTAHTTPNPPSTPLSKIKTLTLHADRLTTHRRLPPIPQLTCTGGSAQHLYTIDTLRCTNSGTAYDDATDIQWTCTASLPPEFKLGSTEVTCEGFEGPEDENVLRGSCAVGYRLLLTEKGEERYGNGGGKDGKGGGEDRAGQGGEGGGGAFVVLFWVLFVGVLVWMVYSACVNWGEGQRLGGAPLPDYNGYGGGGGGDGDDNDDPPPPPYTSSPPQPPRWNAKNGNNGGSNSNSGWKPGFWTGALGGAAAGYAVGNARGSSSSRRGGSGNSPWNDNGEGSSYNNGYGSGGYGSGSGSGSGSGYGSGSGSSGSGSGSAHSSTRYQSTGFGGTSRR
ncbi:hypothetical protein EJ05DRAFT_86902 [Pseudovirgaria hyperparasitica]|uniref:Store-operated calcium entry-associated regulatory factor n=1 Tax=Pseudovirgaria hyperparasitica TaxID=470096 RepID=A0A6A6VZF6_9PEZI|nr:uncharacterized protein EJ05DRAFT_86902 [Pseudovirgaria hyperparasitica]KAF2756032.1 hypothetical protein EJ05DRAFT_86902 [Pseudovirgaria hyperparasitica]